MTRVLVSLYIYLFICRFLVHLLSFCEKWHNINPVLLKRAQEMEHLSGFPPPPENVYARVKAAPTQCAEDVDKVLTFPQYAQGCHVVRALSKSCSV